MNRSTYHGQNSVATARPPKSSNAVQPVSSRHTGTHYILDDLPLVYAKVRVPSSRELVLKKNRPKLAGQTAADFA